MGGPQVSDANPELSMKEYTKEEFFKVMKTAVQEPEAWAPRRRCWPCRTP